MMGSRWTITALLLFASATVAAQPATDAVDPEATVPPEPSEPPATSPRSDPWHAYQSERFRLDVALGFHRFEQQVKAEIGGEAGVPLVEETAGALGLEATYNVWKFLRFGLFAQLDVGSRYATRFDRIEDGAPIVEERTGGRYTEIWLGPMVRFQWRGLFAQVGYGALGIRSDTARDDLPGEDGRTDGWLRVSPRIAWRFGVGVFAPVRDDLDVVLRVDYRVRYYVTRNGEPLADDLVHGTQDLTPFLGVSWHPR